MKDGGWIRRMFEAGIALKKKHGQDRVFDLSLGNPVAEPPLSFNIGLQKIAASPTKGMHRYMPNNGYTETRQAVADQLKSETSLGFSVNDILMTCGTAGGLNVVLKTILNPGDEVIIFAPYFVEYLYYVENHGGVTVIAETDSDFQIDLDKLDDLISPRCRAVIINSPNNPTGSIYDSKLLERLGTLLRSKQSTFGSEIFLISDEPYRRIIFDNIPYAHIYSFHDPSIAVYSHSKDLGLPGERIGYVAINPNYNGKSELYEGLTFCNRTLGFVNAPALMQHLIRSMQNEIVDIRAYQKKRDYLYSNLTSLGYDTIKPQGAFYFFPKSPIADDIQFVEELQKYNVLVVPGTGFGKPGYFRISYCVEDHVLEGAIEGFALSVSKFRPA